MIAVNLQCGDCLELVKNIPTESIDLIVTDPPYKIVSGGCTTKKNATSGILNQNTREVKTGKLFSNNDISFSEWLPEVFRVLKQNTHCYIMINGRNLSELHQESKKVGFEYQNLLVWDKGNVTPNKWYMNQCEFILMLRKGKARNINNMGTSTLLQYKNIIGKKLHPTEKPIELMMLMIENSSFSGDTILDPFMGVGSTGVACAITDRNFIGMELDKQYFDIAVKRIAEADKAVIHDVC